MIVGTLEGRLYSIAIKTTEVLWSIKTSGRIYSKPLLLGNTLFVSSAEQFILIIKSEDGKVIKRITTAGKNYGSASVLKERIVVGSTSGIICEIDNETGSIISQLQLPDRITNEIVYSEPNGIYFARTYDGRIFAFRKEE